MCSNFLWGKTISIAEPSELVNPYAFYLIEFCSLYVVMWLMKVMCHWRDSNLIAKMFICLGNYSLDIMITHLTFFKLLYILYIRITSGSLTYVQFVDRYSILCLVVGLTAPVVVRKGFKIIYYITRKRVW